MDKFHLPDIWRLIISIFVCQLAGIIGSVFTTPQISTWYATLKKPSFSPPNWLFGPVWITLFLLMGISLFIVWRKGLDTPSVRGGLTLFGIQLVFNVLWSVSFFGFKSPISGLFVIVILWIMILLTILQFSKITEPAAILLIPYIVWVSFAAILNLSLFLLNR
ncbi:MAG: TspO/MBR family protein [bacterium]